MLLTKKSRDNRRKEIEALIEEEEQKIEDIQKIVSEFKTKYLPMRDKCVEIIRSYNLGRYPLYEVFSYKYVGGKLRLAVVDTKEEYWNGEPTLRHDYTLFDVTIHMDIPESYDSFINNGASCYLRRLEDPTGLFIRRIISLCHYIDNLKVELAKLNK